MQRNVMLCCVFELHGNYPCLGIERKLLEKGVEPLTLTQVENTLEHRRCFSRSRTLRGHRSMVTRHAIASLCSASLCNFVHICELA